jgi:hypothetical protein
MHSLTVTCVFFNSEEACHAHTITLDPLGHLFYVLKRSEIRILSEQPAAVDLAFQSADAQQQEQSLFSDYVACTQTDGTSVVIDSERHGLKVLMF